jgi:hypothetical protein
LNAELYSELDYHWAIYENYLYNLRKQDRISYFKINDVFYNDKGEVEILYSIRSVTINMSAVNGVY